MKRTPIKCKPPQSKRAKATAIPNAVKDEVYRRDGFRCVFCGSPNGLPECHVISRAKGGLGVPQNIVTACRYTCHKEFDEGAQDVREAMMAYAIEYLKQFYPDWEASKYVYRKWG